jgi:hypothetical protein
LSLKTKVDSLLVVWPQNYWDGLSVVWPQNHWDSLWVVWPQNRSRCFFWFGLKAKGDGFLVWVSKPVATVWWFGLQNHRDGFLVCASKLSGLLFIGCATKLMGEWFDAGHMSRSGGLLRLKASRARVFQSGLKTGGGMMMGGVGGIIVEVVSS